jgi:HlyD family secretion protein
VGAHFPSNFDRRRTIEVSMSKPNKRRLVVVASIVVVLAFALYRAGLFEALSNWGSGKPSGQIVLSGNIETHESTLSFKGVQSRIVQLPFNEGQWVKQGTVVAVVDSQDLKQQVAIAGAAVALQRRQLDAAAKNLDAASKIIDADRAELVQRQRDAQRSQELQKQGFVSTAALDSASTALTQARAILARDQALEQLAQRNMKVVQASLDSAEQSIQLSRIVEGYARLIAPFDGVILARQAELGEVVAPGTPVVTLADLDHVWLRAYLNETDLGRVRLGQSVSITTDTYPQKSFPGRIAFIASQAEYTPKSVETHAERVTLVYRVKIDIDNPDHVFLPGMPADAKIAPAAPN